MEKEAFLSLKDVYKLYTCGEEEVKALDGINLQVSRGEFVTIAGSSGSGKSTLMNILGCLDKPTSGEYILDGSPVWEMGEAQLAVIRNREIGFIFQGFHLLPGLTARENVELPLRYRGIRASQRRQMAEEALEQVGLKNRIKHKPGQMSGGQQQRVAIARALAGTPPLLLADEPTGNLDTESGEEIMELLHKLHRKGHTVLLITHDPRIAAGASRLLEMQDGHLKEVPAPSSKGKKVSLLPR